MQNLITSIRKILIICGCWASRCVGKWPRLFGLYPLLTSLSYLFSCHCNSKFGLSYVIHKVLQAVQSSTVLLCLIRYCIFFAGTIYGHGSGIVTLGMGLQCSVFVVSLIALFVILETWLPLLLQYPAQWIGLTAESRARESEILLLLLLVPRVG